VQAELSTLLSAVDTDGFLPAVMFRDPADRPRIAELGIPVGSPCGSSTIQPPVVGAALERVFEATGDTEWLTDNLDAALRHFRWLGTARSDGRGLVLIERPDESGLDHSPKYDEALGLAGSDAERFLDRWSAAMEHLARRDFAWSYVLVSAIYGDGLRCLARLCRQVSREQDAAACDAQADQLTAALIRSAGMSDVGSSLIDGWVRRRPTWTPSALRSCWPTPVQSPTAVGHLLDRCLRLRSGSQALPTEPVRTDRSGALFRVRPGDLNCTSIVAGRHGRADAATELARGRPHDRGRWLANAMTP
jgi:hypothetical protein